MEKDKKENSFMIRLSTLIVDKRKGFYLIFIMLILFSVASMNRVNVNNDLTSYLPDTTETRQGLDLMEEQFITYGTARVMVCNITCEEAEELAERLESMEGVSMLDFDDSPEHYHNMEALFDITFDGTAGDEGTLERLNQVLEALEGYDVYYSSDIGQEERDASDLSNDMIIILMLAGVVIVCVLLFTSTTYAEIPVFLMTFIVAAILNKGTNYWFGTISFVTDSIAVVLQLALAVDYAIILCHRFMEEHEDKDAREAAIVALSKAIPEISSSSLTTVSGMVAMMFMQFRIGYDMGIVLAKAILLSLISVFFLMPGLLLTFAKAIDNSHHRSFVPKITAVGRLCVHTRYLIPPLLVAAVIGILYWFFGTELGASLRATGANQNMARAQGIHTERNKVLGLMLSNGLVAFSGALLSQYQSFADASMGKGAIVIGLAAVIIGQVLFSKLFHNFALRLLAVSIGSMIYYVVIQAVVSLSGIDTNYLKLISAVIVALFLAVPYWKGRYFAKRTTRGGRSNA